MKSFEKYIKLDIENGISYMKVGLMNALNQIYIGEEQYIELEKHIPFSLVLECCESALQTKLTITNINSDIRLIEDPEHYITVTVYINSGKVIINHYD